MKKQTVVGIVILTMGAILIGSIIYFKNQIDKAINYCYKLRAVRFIKLQKDNIIFEIDILINNRSEFDIQINSYELGVYIDNIFITTIKSKNVTQIISPQSKNIVTAVVDFKPDDLSPDQVGQIITKAIFNRDKLSFRVSGKLAFLFGGLIEMKEFPIEISMTMKEIMEDSPESEERMVCKEDLKK